MRLGCPKPYSLEYKLSSQPRSIVLESLLLTMCLETLIQISSDSIFVKIYFYLFCLCEYTVSNIFNAE